MFIKILFSKLKSNEKFTPLAMNFNNRHKKLK